MLSQFQDSAGHLGLSHFDLPPKVYPAGRLDRDSEGLLLLTNHGPLQARISSPKHKWPKRYWVQLEGEIAEDALEKLRAGPCLNDGPTLEVAAQRIVEPKLPARNPPVRERKSIPTCWLEIILCEGRNRQIRRMTAAIGHPTLRLFRQQIGPIDIQSLAPGQWREYPASEIESLWRYRP